MDGQSLNIAEEKKAILQSALPEIFTEGKIDLEKLKLAIGEDLNIQNERYVLNWAGKSEAFKALQTPTTATLIPNREQSVNFDTTENIFIEGENLEVLKVLQKSYYGKIKMIYIDPPYNTGNDSFVYPDRFAESKEEYMKRIGEKDEEGYLLKEGLFRKNSKENGQYHSNWLSMMYPRLFLARNLLRDDGVIFVSIDDNEVHNLRSLMNEVFGEESFVASIIWQKKYAVSADDPGVAAMHDYILTYRRSPGFQRKLLPRTEKQISRYKNIDNDPRGPWSSDNYVSNKSREERPTLWYSIKHPKTGLDVWPDASAVWRFSKDNHIIAEEENRLYWGPDLSYDKPRLKRFLNEIQDGIVPSTWWEFKEVGHNDEGQKETAELLGKKVFSTPKPIRLLKRMLEISVDDGDYVLDFFAGSCSTAHAVIDFNYSKQRDVRFISVQLPEKCSVDSTAIKAGLNTISDIGRKRLEKAIEKIEKDRDGKLNLYETARKLDLGYKSLTIAPSNFKIWRGDITNPDELVEQVNAFVDPTKQGKSEENML